MKKFVSVLLTVVAAVGLCFGVAGCKKSNISEIVISDKTAEKPYFDDNTVLAKEINKSWKFNSKEPDNYFEDFLNYVNNDFKKISKSNFIILNPQSLNKVRYDYSSRLYNYNLCGDLDNKGKISNPLIREQFLIYDEALNQKYNESISQEPPVYGNLEWSLKFNFIGKQIDNGKIGDKLVLEFGRHETEDTEQYQTELEMGYTDFINLYTEENCVATVHFTVFKYSEITLDWFESFFTENLYFGDNKCVISV